MPPSSSDQLLDLIRKEEFNRVESHSERLISAMKSALETTVPGRAGYPNESKKLFEEPAQEMI